MTDKTPSSRKNAPSPARAFLISVFCSGLGLGLLLLSDRGTAAWRRAQEESRSLKKEIAALQKENAALSARTHSAERSTYELEKIARERLGLVKPDEVVFILPAAVENRQTPKR